MILLFAIRIQIESVDIWYHFELSSFYWNNPAVHKLMTGKRLLRPNVGMYWKQLLYRDLSNNHMVVLFSREIWEQRQAVFLSSKYNESVRYISWHVIFHVGFFLIYILPVLDVIQLLSTLQAYSRLHKNTIIYESHNSAHIAELEGLTWDEYRLLCCTISN